MFFFLNPPLVLLFSRAPENGTCGARQVPTSKIWVDKIIFKRMHFLKYSPFFFKDQEYVLDKKSSRLEKKHSVRQDKAYDSLTCTLICWLICPTWQMVVEYFFRQFPLLTCPLCSGPSGRRGGCVYWAGLGNTGRTEKTFYSYQEQDMFLKSKC